MRTTAANRGVESCRVQRVSTADIVGVAGILVGGRSTRMGYPKAALTRPDGRTWVEHIADAARHAGPWLEETVILGHCSALPASLSTLSLLPDARPNAGPLAGLCSLLRHAGRRWALLLACDMPLIEATLLERLHSAINPEFDAVVFSRSNSPNGWHACCAFYHPRLLPVALHAFEQGSRSLQRLLLGARLRVLDSSPADEHALTNVNDREEYARLCYSKCGRIMSLPKMPSALRAATDSWLGAAE